MMDEEQLRQQIIAQQQARLGGQLNMQAANMPMPNPAMQEQGFFGKLGGLGRRAGIGMQNGMNRLAQGMFPVDPSVAAHLSPEQIRGMRSNSMMQMGLGMLGSAGQGKGLGESLASGYFGAQENMLGREQQMYKLGANEREEARTRERDAESDRRYGVETGQAERQFGMKDRDFRAGRGDEMWMRDYRDRQLKEMSKYRMGMLGAQSGSGQTAYTPEAIDMLANSTLRSPSLMNAYMSRSGRYNQGERRMVIERQAEILKENGLTPSQVASIHANVKAQTGNIQAQTKSLQGLKAFDSVARANADRALQLFSKVSDTGIPIANALARGAQYGMGNEDVAELRQVLQNFQAETARIVAGHPQLLGATTDTARQEIERIVSGDMTVGQAERVIKRLLFEVDVRRQGFEESMQESAASMDQLGLPGQTPQRAGAPWAAPNAPAPNQGVVNWDDLQ